jgi:hypothetical protein
MTDEYTSSPEKRRGKLERLPSTRPEAARAIEDWVDDLPEAATAAFAPVRFEATPRLDRAVRLTIGMATFDDYDGVYFTAQAIRLYHPEVADETEILVVDNNPTGVCAEALKNLDSKIPGYRYVPYDRTSGTAVRDLVFREAAGEYVLCLDSHVMLVPGALRRLLDYLDRNSDTNDLLQGPLLYDDGVTISTHMDPEWREGMYGTWGTDPRGVDLDANPFEIRMQGLGLFACRRVVWPGFNPGFTGFGGEEGYIHEKFRRRGGRVICLPFLRWAHRFERPFGTQYPNAWPDRVRNYALGFAELGLDLGQIRDHFEEHIGEGAREIVDIAFAEASNPFTYFDAIYCVNLDGHATRWEAMRRRFETLGIDWRVLRFSAVDTPSNHRVGRALSHRAIVAEAKWRGLRNVLVFEDDAMILDDVLTHLGDAVCELDGLEWSLFYLGGFRRGEASVPLPGRPHLGRSRGMTLTHAIAYSARVFDRLLEAIPETEADVAECLADARGIDHFYADSFSHEAVAMIPSVATQPALLGDDEARERYS